MDYFKAISSVHFYTRLSLNQNMFVYTVQTTQYGITPVQNSGIHVKEICPFSRCYQNIENSINEGYNSVIELVFI